MIVFLLKAVIKVIHAIHQSLVGVAPVSDAQSLVALPFGFVCMHALPCGNGEERMWCVQSHKHVANARLSNDCKVCKSHIIPMEIGVCV